MCEDAHTVKEILFLLKYMLKKAMKEEMVIVFATSLLL